jgi:hypothetical protein
MKKVLLSFALLFCMGCGGSGSSGSGSGGGGNPTPAGPATMSGTWEIVASSTANPGSSYPFTGIEANLNQTGTSVSSTSRGTVVLPFANLNPGVGIAEDACGNNVATIEGSITGQVLTFTVTETGEANTLVISGTGTISSTGNSITGNYSTPGGCGFGSDSGTFSGVAVPSLSGTYQATFNDGTSLTLQVVEDAQQNLTVSGTSQATPFTLTGNVVGGALVIQGDVPSFGNITYLGFYMSPSLVSIFPTVDTTSTQVGDMFLMNANDPTYFGLARKQ